jgi:pimeloyl-ACP methyl ester carboxylesterase
VAARRSGPGRLGAEAAWRFDIRVEIVRAVPHISYARSADGVSLAFTVAGTGPALVFVPWVPFSNLHMEWQNPLLHGVFERLSRRLTLIHYDGRGTGHSQRDVADLSLDAMI